MGKYNCPRCGKTFKQKSHFETHKKRKNPCENTMDTVKELVERAVEERLNSITPIENTFKPDVEEINQTEESTQDDILSILNKTLETNSYSDIANYLNVAIGTVKRWKELNSVPPSYQFDLMKLNNIPIDYSKFSYKEKDQFFTPIETANKCFTIFQKFLQEKGETDDDYTYIEPSAGDGSFLKILPENRTFAIDIEPKGENIETADYLTWSPPPNHKYIVFGNPPFGLRGQLALKFVNHSASFADYVCFILPQLFESDGKGVPRKRVKGYTLVHSEKLDTSFYEPSQKEVKVNCIFQIWSKNHTSDKYSIQKTDNDIIKIYSLSDGGTPSTTRNKKMFYNCDMYIPSTCFGKNNMTYYTTFDKLPRRRGYGVVFNKNKEENMEKFKNIIWNDVAFLSTNSAYNIRSSQIIEQFV
tara:strand:+ start:8062 stop:9306 length:1245 start_codon:yes stop_codon:yes gene_type:complete